MKSTGIVRKIDELGRVVLPIELRREMSIREKDPIEIFVEGETIILKKYEPGCSFCDEVSDTQNDKNLVEFKGKMVCQKCLKELKHI